MTNRPSLGFACRWYRPDPRPTWSYTPWNLRSALQRGADVVDVGPELSRSQEMALKAAHLRLEGGRVVSRWGQGRATARLSSRDLLRRVQRSQVQGVLQMMDYAIIRDRPNFLYQDLSRALVLERHGTHFPLPAQLNDLTKGQLEAGLGRQQEIYASSHTIFCMSQWLADSIVRSGIPRSKVRVVPPGINAVAASRTVPGVEAPTSSQVPRSRLLLVGRDLLRKGLQEVLAALRVLREHRPDVTLTVAGPSSWPLRGSLPEGVTFLGALSTDQVAEQFARHDLYVMPSQWEAFGIAFAEALVAGLPCIARNDCAMPEIISAPDFGRLVGAPGADIDPTEFATSILECLEDDALFRRVREASPTLHERYSWSTAADTMLEVIREAVGTTDGPKIS